MARGLFHSVHLQPLLFDSEYKGNVLWRHRRKKSILRFLLANVRKQDFIKGVFKCVPFIQGYSHIQCLNIHVFRFTKCEATSATGKKDLQENRFWSQNGCERYNGEVYELKGLLVPKRLSDTTTSEKACRVPKVAPLFQLSGSTFWHQKYGQDTSTQ